MNAASDIDLKRLRELALRCAHAGVPQYTRFMEPALLDDVRAAAGKNGVKAAFWGGYEDAERVMAAFYDGVPPKPGDWPICTIRITWNAKFAHPEHRDLLGAVMGLGMERDAVGDIALGTWRGAPCAWLFVTPEMADYVAANLESAGRAAVKAEVTDDAPVISPPEGVELRVTVQNPRLDAVAAVGWRLSRNEAQRLVAAGLVKLNHVVNLHSDARVETGDLISARGHGRIRVLDMPDESRRGRTIVTLFRYGR